MYKKSREKRRNKRTMDCDCWRFSPSVKINTKNQSKVNRKQWKNEPPPIRDRIRFNLAL